MATIKPYNIVREFEEQIAKWAGAPYGVAVESCSAAIFLSLQYVKHIVGTIYEITIPSRTYPSIPCNIIHIGSKIKWNHDDWIGTYELKPYKIIDSALRLRPNMYKKGTLHCLSFHIKKHLPIGRGGMILTDSKYAYQWLKKARFDGRDEVFLRDDPLTQLGWNMYMTPDQAARGLELFSHIHDKIPKDLEMDKQNYPDLSKYDIYNT